MQARCGAWSQLLTGLGPAPHAFTGYHENATLRVKAVLKRTTNLNRTLGAPSRLSWRRLFFNLSGPWLVIYIVKRYRRAVWDEAQPMQVDANTAATAAEKVCGTGLRAVGKLGELCAEAWPANGPSGRRTAFYRPEPE